ncbi:hypothetical protein [Dulcicalothrix desertica]|uniref:hypothetical protein n=1 Tax=Dulcicalothrix desertica TaxID=32056 RepID=UPI000F8EC0C8|nr:hypothetical protein [Dulcicalothrix desertica]
MPNHFGLVWVYFHESINSQQLIIAGCPNFVPLMRSGFIGFTVYKRRLPRMLVFLSGVGADLKSL